MLAVALEVLSWLCLVVGGGFGVIGGIGLLRFPDLYTRLHAGSVTDTLVPLLIIIGLILQSGLSLLSLKLVLILAFLLFTTPTASHALARAALSAGIRPQARGTQATDGEDKPSST